MKKKCKRCERRELDCDVLEPMCNVCRKQEKRESRKLGFSFGGDVV